jgi:transposase
LKASEQNRPDIVAKRAEWKVMQLGLNPKKLVFLDETGAKTNMTRLYGRAPIGQRLVDRTPHGHYVNNTYICGLRHDRIVAPHVFVGAMNSARFVEYIETILLPTLHKGDIVVMDNLSAHLDGRVKVLIESKGASVLYLPAYSPDLNPIELSFSKLKSALRREKIREVPALQKFLLESGSLFTKKECQAYFKHYGYTAHK